MGTVPKVSVWMVTYNHQDYIAQAVESVMMQQTDFNVHLFIGEDFSSDNTRVICQSLKQKYPDQISLVLNEKNLGANENAKNIYKACFTSGAKYIAMLEGDDYWTDPLKLQKQVNFMERNLDYSICFHNVQIYDQIKNTLKEDNKIREVPVTTSILDLAKGNYIHTPSVIFRNVFTIPDWFCQSPLGDWTLYMVVGSGGKIFKIQDSMAVYRNHEESIWSIKSKKYRIENTLKSFSLVHKNLSLTQDVSVVLKAKIFFFKKQLHNLSK